MPDDDIEIDLCREGDPYTVTMSPEEGERFFRAAFAWARENGAPVYKAEAKPSA